MPGILCKFWGHIKAYCAWTPIFRLGRITSSYYCHYSTVLRSRCLRVRLCPFLVMLLSAK